MLFFSLIRVHGRRLAAMAVFCLALPAVPALGAEQRFSESTEVTVVEVPVQVLKDGQPVRGLTAADFEVYQGREKQAVTGFEVLDLASAAARPDAARRLPMSARRRFVLLFDLGFSKPNSLARARQSARDLLSQAFHSTDLIAVAAYLPSKGPQFLLGFTSDRAAVLAALDRLDPMRNPQALAGGGFDMSSDPLMLGGGLVESAGSQRETARDRGDTAAGGEGGAGEGGVGLPDGIDPFLAPIERAERDQQRQGIAQFTRAIGAFADALASVRGRKYVVLLSEGFESSAALGTTDEDEMLNMDAHSVRGDTWNIDSDRRFGNAKASGDLERMLEELRRADCAVQAVDIGGVRANAEDVHAGRARGADGLSLMASATGGEFYPNFNNLSSAMGKMLDRTSVTYVLSIQPDVKRDGQYHKLRVELKDGKAGRVVYRPGFYAPKPFGQETGLERTLQTAGQLISGQEGGPVGLSVLAAPFRITGEKAYVPVLIEIDGPSLAANLPGPVLPAEVYAYALDDKGSVVDFFTQTVGLDLAKVGEAVKKTGVKFFGDLDLPPGSYSVRVLVRNAKTGAAGLRVASLEVPAFAAGAAVLLPPFFPEPAGRWLMLREAKVRQGEVEYPFMSQNQPYIPASRPALEPGKAAALALVGYHLGAGRLQAQAMVMTAEGKEMGEGKINVLAREAASGDGPDRLKATFQPPGLQPGEYMLLVTLTNAQGASETSVAPFVVPASSGAAGGPAR
ncbi:MAG: VWA domain-containing protein [Thermoanaerobaculia bacterium]